MSELKIPLTIEQQVDRLQLFHNLKIENKEDAINILQSINYYRLSAYGLGLKKSTNNEEYKDGISIDYLYKLYCFDSIFKNYIMHIIEQIEIQLRALISNHLALTYGADGYVDKNNFITKTSKDNIEIHDLIMKNLDDEIKRQKNAPMVKHHICKYNSKFPIWVAVELLSFGNLSYLYDIMKTDDKKEIADFYKTSPKYLKSWIISLIEVRNICAHYSRLYNMVLKQTPSLYKEHIQYKSKLNKLFPVILVIKRMIGETKWWDEFFVQMQKLFNEYSSVINLNFMGFPKNWIAVLSEKK